MGWRVDSWIEGKGGESSHGKKGSDSGVMERREGGRNRGGGGPKDES